MRAAIAGLLDDRLCEAFEFAPAPAVARLTRAATAVRASALRVLPKRRRPRLRTQIGHRSYPQGWRLEEPGPPGHRRT